MRPPLAAPRRRRSRFVFALVAGLFSAAWDDCCCWDPPRLAEPDGGGRILQPFAPAAYTLFSYDGGPAVGTRVGATGWDPQLRLSTAWTGLGRISYDGKPAFVTSIVRESDEYPYVGSTLGLLGLNLLSGSVRSFSGIPSSGPTISTVVKRPAGGVYVGLFSAAAAGIPLAYQCQLSNATCTAVPGGPVSAKAMDGVSRIRIFNGATYVLSSLGTWSSPDYGMFFKEGTPSAANLDIAGEDGNLVVTTDTGAYKGAGRGGSWALDSTGLGTTCRGATYIAQTFYVACFNPTLQVYRRSKTETSWTSTGLTLFGDGSAWSLEADGADVLLGTNVGPYRYRGGLWALDDPCYKSPSAISAVRLDGQTLAVAGGLGGYSESTDGGRTWTDPRALRIGARYIAKNSAGTYLSSGLFRPAGASAFQPFTFPLGGISALGTAGDVVLAGGFSGGVGTLSGTSFQAMNTGFDTTATVGGFASNGTSVYVFTPKGNFFSPSLSLSWTKRPNRPDGQPFIGYCGTALSNGDYLLGGYNNPSGANIQRSDAAGTTLTNAGVGIPNGAVVLDLKEIPNGPLVRGGRDDLAAAGPTAIVAATSLGLYVSFDGATSWSLLSKELGATPINSLAVGPDRLWVATGSRGLTSYSLPLRFRRLVPIVLDVDTGTAHYTTELAITNPGTTTAAVAFQYTAAIGTGSITVSDTIAPGRQLVVPDALNYLRSKGAPIPVGGSQGGTLLLTFTNVSAAGVPAVTARTTAATGAPLPVGRAGLAYGAHDPDEGSRGTLTVYGLRSNATDRSNFAVYNTSNEAVTFSVTAYDGNGSGASAVVAAADTLPAWGWKQYNRILEGPGYAQGWVRVTRTSTTGSFGVYGVVNDNGTNDGSLLGPGASSHMPAYTNVPVLVETGAFVSELVLANPGAAAATFRLSYRESLAGSGGGSTDVVVAAKTQLLVPSAIAYLRSRGVPIGAAGGSYAGSLHVEVVAGSAEGTWVGARTSSPTPSGGQFGLFTPAAEPGGEGQLEAFVFGLRSDSENRSNVAAVNTGDTDDGSLTLSIQAYDGDAAGAPRGAATTVTLAPGQWQQFNNFLAGVGVSNGWVKVTRTAGFAPWIAYGVVNDGAGPGQRTSDGAYVAMTR